ncbi:aldo/keto reductase [Oceaniradius stylonematis]|uniref:aldo/keto reductase n=1 Tax=Oceaniradius stylonematis TaxID=2184161 RepID=UPI00273E54CF|nr:aldo/keto reductase [Oceaniradius stylonematis]
MTDTPNRTYRIGGDIEVNRIGFGAMRLTGQPGNFGPYEDWEGGISLLRAAADDGVTFFDSARSYGPLTADRIVGEALADRDVALATKGGVDKPEPGRITADGSRDTLLRQVDESLVNLRRDRIDLFQLHRVDPETPVEVSVAALAEARADGRIAHIGLSNVTREELDRALAVAPIASVQNRFNMDETGDDGLVDYTAARGIAFIPYGPLGANPMQHGAKLAPREALAWLLERSPNIIAIPGTTSVGHMRQNITAWDLL